MTIAEAEVFYGMDKEKYILSGNKEFLKWYSKQQENGYPSYIEISGMQELINNIALWYEMKYPEKEFEFCDDTRFHEFKNIESISKYLSFEQLMYRLPHKQYSIIKSGYRARGWSYPDQIFIKVDIEENKFPFEIISADYKTGIIRNLSHGGLNVKYSHDITLDELVTILENSKRTDINFKELKDCVNNHNIDLELRKKVLQLVSLKILYSKNTIPEYGYKRAKRFIEEFNNEIPNLNLTTFDIDKIMKIDYKKEYEKLKYKRLLKK